MSHNNVKNLIGVDLGGTKVNVGLVRGHTILDSKKAKLPKNQKDEWDVINLIIDTINQVRSDHEIQGIGIGVPSILDKKEGIIYEVQNIPTWKEVPLGPILEKEFSCPVFMNNDASCFALGEYYFGSGKGCENFVGITLGTGLGAGIITRGKLLDDANCGSGEFGMIPYKDGIMEDYCSGKFFKKFHNSDGEEFFNLAKEGDKKALEAFEEFGMHLGNAIKMMMYAVDPQQVIIGGSIASAMQFFDKSLRKCISDFSYSRTYENLKIRYTQTPNIALLGTASLCYENYGFKP